MLSKVIYFILFIFLMKKKIEISNLQFSFKEVFEERKMTYKELSDKTWINVSNLNQILNGKITDNLSIWTILKICNGLNIDIDEALSWYNISVKKSEDKKS